MIFSLLEEGGIKLSLCDMKNKTVVGKNCNKKFDRLEA